MLLPHQPNQSLINGLECLQWVVGSADPVGSRELARSLDLDTTRVNRLLKTLAHLGLLKQDAARKYHPGPRIHVLAAQALFGSRLLLRALPILESLHDVGGKHTIVAFGVLWRDRVSYLYHASPGMSATEALGRAGLYPAIDSGIGLALLAELSLSECRRVLGKDVMKQAGDTIRETKKLGYAITPPAHDGQQTVGHALPDYSAAIAIRTHLTPRKTDKIITRLQDASQAIYALSEQADTSPAS